MNSPLIESLINSLRCLPGVGPKSAQRMAFHLLEKNRNGGLNLANSLVEAMDKVAKCKQCRILCETEICSICDNKNRDNSILCVVENQADVVAIEQTATYNGLYFVLLGRLSPIEGISPEDIGINLFQEKLQSGDVKEIIMATNPTVEGEATAFYLAEIAKNFNINVTRITHGVPMGGELEYIDSNTISRALTTRSEFIS